MAGSLNKVMLIGNLGADPEVRRLNSGAPVVNMRVATSQTWKDKETGERKEKTEWHSVVIMNEHLCKVAEDYLKKGSKVYVEGELQTRQWEDKDGIKRYTTEVFLSRFGGALTILDSRQGSGSDRDNQYEQMDQERYGNRRSGGSPNDTGHGRREPQSQGSRYNDLDDDIPF